MIDFIKSIKHFSDKKYCLNNLKIEYTFYSVGGSVFSVIQNYDNFKKYPVKYRERIAYPSTMYEIEEDGVCQEIFGKKCEELLTKYRRKRDFVVGNKFIHDGEILQVCEWEVDDFNFIELGEEK